MKGREGHQTQLAIGREEEAAGVAEQRQQGLEDLFVERLSAGLEAGLLELQGLPQAGVTYRVADILSGAPTGSAPRGTHGRSGRSSPGSR